MSQLVYRSGKWEIDLDRREMRSRGYPVPIGSRAFDIIEVLVLSVGQLVSKDELLARVWPGVIAEENTLQVHVSAVRKALGPDRGMLKTAMGRGYRLLGSWTAQQASEAPASVPSEAEPTVPARFQSSFPVSISDIIGRSNAVRQLRDLLSAHRMITLTGPGGIGKTVLALEVARSLLPSFGGDGRLVELGTLTDPSLVPLAVATTIGLNLGADVTAHAVAEGIGEKKLLLILDTCEHVVDVAADLAETIIHLCPSVTVLVTSREVLRIAGEQVYCVQPLQVFPRDCGNPTNSFEHSAVQLFVARAKAMHGDFSPEREDLSRIATICRRLDGIPLAIEFAAAREAALGIAQVVAHLDDRFGLLIGGRRTAHPRHRTLRAVFDWSYELLLEPERCLLRQLASFSGSFTLEAAVDVMREHVRNTCDVADGLSNLVSKSLVSLDPRVPGGRWRLLETIRAYALEKLAECNEPELGARRHAGSFRDAISPGTVGLSRNKLPTHSCSMAWR